MYGIHKLPYDQKKFIENKTSSLASDLYDNYRKQDNEQMAIDHNNIDHDRSTHQELDMCMHHNCICRNRDSYTKNYTKNAGIQRGYGKEKLHNVLVINLNVFRSGFFYN